MCGEAAWDAVFTQDEHDRLVAKLTDPARNENTWAGRAEARYLLTGIVTCGLCKGPMYAQGAKTGRPRYSCTRGPGKWGEVTRLITEVDGETELCILAWMADGGLFDQAATVTESEDVQDIRAQRDKAQAGLDALALAGAAARWDRAKLDRQMAPYHARIAELDQRLRATEAAVVSRDVLAVAVSL